MTTKWNHPRCPLAEDVQNLLRCKDYWKSLLLHDTKDELRPAIIVYESYQLKSITTPAQADYEAFHMVHSVGLNYDKYASECSIYSIRTQPGNSLTKHFIELFGREVIGEEFMADAPPSHLQKSHLFTTEGERSLSYQIGGINGINTSLDCAVDHADYIGRLTSGKSIDWVYNNSHGVLADLFLEIPANYSGMSPNTAQILTDNWVCFDQKNQDNLKAKYLQFCHSQGAIHVKNALENAPQEIRERVIVVAIAPAAVIPKKLCFQSTNYASKKDVVPLGELIFAGFNEPEIKQELLETAWQHHKELILLDPHPDATGIDHDFQSPTFTEIIEKHLKDYLKK